jgi:hypothetical protein
MLTPILTIWRQRLSAALLSLAALLVLALPASPASAAPAPASTTAVASAVSATVEGTPLRAALSKELEALQTQSGLYSVQQARRLADLSRLETAIADSSDGATVDNATDHSLGLFVRGKRQRQDQPATFVVLGPGHQIDDDVESVALFIPANVPVSWPGRAADAAATPARVVPLLPGEELEVSAPESGQGYRLSLPAIALDSERPELGALPSFSQSELDAQPETAPID